MNAPTPSQPSLSNAKSAQWDTIAVIGHGLIGGSIAWAIHERGLARSLRTWDPSPEVRALAAQRFGEDVACRHFADAVRDAQLVVIASPVSAFHSVLDELLREARPDALITDVTSVKSPVLDLVKQVAPARGLRFVPAHPIAGGERSGPWHASPDLLQGRVVVTTPDEMVDKEAVRQVAAFWSACGAQVVQMSAVNHDHVFGAVSHVPHVLAYAYLASWSEQLGVTEKLALAGPGFRDFTRIAAASPSLWAEICLANKDAVLNELTLFNHCLQQLMQALRVGDAESLITRFSQARERRLRFEDEGFASYR
jgi:prephenate dehydrogenase